jgi:hypothetical protein
MRRHGFGFLLPANQQTLFGISELGRNEPIGSDTPFTFIVVFRVIRHLFDRIRFG